LARFKIRVPAFDWVARVNSFFLKNQNDIVLVKKQTKINELQPGFWPSLAVPTHQTELGLKIMKKHILFNLIIFFFFLSKQ
jgi:hypothetical protein